MQATTDHLAAPELEHARAALDTLVELRDWIPDADDGRRGFALAEVIRTWDSDQDDPIWTALAQLLPPRTTDPHDEASEKIRRATVDLLDALWDAEYQRRDGDEGISLAVFEKLRRAHADIGRTLDVIRLEA